MDRVEHESCLVQVIEGVAGQASALDAVAFHCVRGYSGDAVRTLLSGKAREPVS